MKISKLLDVNKIAVEDIKVKTSEIHESFLKIRIKATGICGSDLHYFNDGGLGSHKIDFPIEISTYAVLPVYVYMSSYISEYAKYC